jgi:4-hydroxy-3-methylbut-2-enyl diphosphate reductase
MLASETTEIMELFRNTIEARFGPENLKEHFANTRETLCYATNDNQSATMELLKEDADIAIVIGGHNSSNTGHLVELLEKKFDTYFIRSANDLDEDKIVSFDIAEKKLVEHVNYLPEKDEMSIIITSGASCPDAVVDEVIMKLLVIKDIDPQKILDI